MGALYQMGARLSRWFWWGASVPQCGKGEMFFGVAFRMVKKSPERDRRRDRMAKWMVIVRFNGAEVARRGFVHEDAARAYACGAESLGDCEPDGPQFEASVVAL